MKREKSTKKDRVLGNSYRALFLGNLRKSVENKCDLVFAVWYSRGVATVSYSFEQIWFEAGYVARDLLLNKGLEKGDKIILFYENGLEFFIAFLGCLRAGIIAVFMCSSLKDNEMNTSLHARLRTVFMDCDAKLVLVDLRANDYLRRNGEATRTGVDIPFHIHPNLSQELTKSNEKMRFSYDYISSGPANIEDHAFLHYSFSNKTGEEACPKVVAVSFNELEANVESFIDWSLHTYDSMGETLEKVNLFSWLPHDCNGLGLVATLASFLGGWICHTMSPAEFVSDPLLWVKLISRLDVNITFVPNFEYDLVPERIARVKQNGHIFGSALDLSSVVCMLDAAKLIDPSTKSGVREVLISGPSIMRGHFGKAEFFANSSVPVLRGIFLGHQQYNEAITCNCMGYYIVQKNVLFICGCLETLVTVNGIKYFPQDIEDMVQEAVPDKVRLGSVIAFSRNEYERGDERKGGGLEIIVEIHKLSMKECTKTVSSIWVAIAQKLSIQPSHIVVVGEGTLLKDASGKIQRGANRKAYHDGKMNVLHDAQAYPTPNDFFENESCPYFDNSNLIIKNSGKETPILVPPVNGPVISKKAITAFQALIRNDIQPSIRNHSKSSVVVGAGLSGLASAREMLKAGIDVTILEAEHRAGGRCYTMKLSEGVQAEAGGMRFPSNHKILMEYIDEFSLEAIPFSNMKDGRSILYFEGKKTFVEEEINDPSSLLARVAAKWENSIKDIRQAWMSNLMSWSDIVKKYGSISLHDFLLLSGWQNDLIEGFSRFGIGLGPYRSVLGLSFVEILRLFMKRYEGDNLQLKGGMTQLVDAFLFNDDYPLHRNIRFGCRVTHIEKDSETGRHYITYKSSSCSSSELKIECDFVVCSVPLPSLSCITFKPPLRPEIQEAIEKTHYVQATKVIIETASPFWLKHGVDGMIVSDLQVKCTYFARPFENSEKGVILASYVWEEDAEVFLNLSDNEKIDLVVCELSQIFPELKEEFVKGRCVEWKSAFCIFRPGQMEKYQHILTTEISDCVYLAGEHCSCEHGYFEGALESGLRAAINVVSRMWQKSSFSKRLQANAPIGNSVSNGSTNDKSMIPTSMLRSGLRSSTGIFPLRLDHYTLIVENAKEVADFHMRYLGYKFLRVQKVNSGTVCPDEYDMLNYILSPQDSSNPKLVVVITEGLNDKTIFRRYLKKFGAHIHHLAFEVSDIEKAFALTKYYDVETTSNRITHDVLSGLKQFFIKPKHAGFFVELIERDCEKEELQDSSKAAKNARKGFFTQKNMASLAQSIENHVCVPEPVVPKGSERQMIPFNNDMSTLKLGSILCMAFQVSNPEQSVEFFQEFLNFRIVTSNRSGDQVILSLPTSDSDFALIIEKARCLGEQGRSTVYFETWSLPKSIVDLGIEESYNPIGDSVLVSAFYTSYRLAFTTKSSLFSHTRIVRSHGLDLFVYIHRQCDSVMRYLKEPRNLAQWTSHKNIWYSAGRQCWVDTRVLSNGVSQDFEIVFEQQDERRLRIHWPERRLDIQMDCIKAKNGCCLTLKLPTNISERKLAAMKRVISIEMDLLKALLEGNEKIFISERHMQEIQKYQHEMNGTVIAPRFSKEVARRFGFKGDILMEDDHPMMKQMSTDFAMIVYSKPLAILRPFDTEDVTAAICIANQLNIPIVARGSLVSHSAGGQAQINHGLLLDLSHLNSVEMTDHHSVQVGSGAMWDSVIRVTLQHGMMPPVVNDYQYLSVGGTISIGGVGFMSHKEGLQAGHVQELQVVTGDGNLISCSKDCNPRLFDSCRAGLGQYGVMTSVTLPLIPAPKNVAIFKLFYRQVDLTAFTCDVASAVEAGMVDLIHSFLKPSTAAAMEAILGPGKFGNSSREFQQIIKEGDESGNVVFFLELGVYLWQKTDLEKIRSFMASMNCIDGAYFESTLPFHEYLVRDPPVIETNKIHGSVPHPSFATIIGKSRVNELLENHLSWRDKIDDASSEILLMPLKSNLSLGKGHSVPMFPMPEESLSFFILFLTSVIGERKCEDVIKHHRKLFKSACSSKMGGKRYSYDTITSEVRGEDAWQSHYGSATWYQVCLAKREFDPYHILGRGIGMWDVSCSTSTTEENL